MDATHETALPRAGSTIPDTQSTPPHGEPESSLPANEFERFLCFRGERYRNARVATFELHGDRDQQASQRRVLEGVTEFCRTVWDRYQRGQNLLLCGPCGTGKDHLATACVRALLRESAYRQCSAYDAGDRDWGAYRVRVRCVRMVDLLADMRDAQRVGQREADLVEAYTHRCDLLYVDDLVCGAQAASDWDVRFYSRLIGTMYAKRKPIWATANVLTPGELGQQIDPSNSQRILDGAEVFVLNWPTFRAPASVTG